MTKGEKKVVMMMPKQTNQKPIVQKRHSIGTQERRRGPEQDQMDVDDRKSPSNTAEQCYHV